MLLVRIYNEASILFDLRNSITLSFRWQPEILSRTRSRVRVSCVRASRWLHGGPVNLAAIPWQAAGTGAGAHPFRTAWKLARLFLDANQDFPGAFVLCCI